MPTPALAALCGYGGQWLAALWTKGRGLVLACGLVVVDLGAPSFCLNRLAMTHVPLEELPEVGIWRQVGARETDERPGQSFTYNPDHTHYLLPVLGGRVTANIVELCSRNPEYNSYVAHQRKAMLAFIRPICPVNPWPTPRPIYRPTGESLRPEYTTVI